MRDEIVIRGAREHNLKNLNLTIPRDKLIVFTGLSGSGKSSLAFDTIYAEGQRRYVESLSSYARQFLGQMEKPDVDTIEGLSPAISIDQKSTSNNPRSTVGTVTEIHDYLRLLYARIGIPHCPKCGRVIRRQTVDEVVEQVMAFGINATVNLLGMMGRYAFQAAVSGMQNALNDGLGVGDAIGHYWGKLNTWSKVATIGMAALGGYYAYCQARSIYLSIKNLVDAFKNTYNEIQAKKKAEQEAAEQQNCLPTLVALC